jgi:hypothetical protein
LQAILLSGSPTILLFPLPITTKQTLKTTNDASRTTHEPWNKGSLIGQKPPLKLREIWTVRTQLRIAGKTRELGLFNPAIDSTLRGCDLVALRVRDIADGNHVIARASVFRRKTEAREPVRFELTDQTREAVQAWIKEAALSNGNSLFPSRQSGSLHLSARVSTHASSSD